MKSNIMNTEQNIKLENLLKKLFENKEFEYSFNDTSFDGIIVKYTIEYRIEVGNVFGSGLDAEGSVNVIINKILLNNEDFYYRWENSGYGETWYISELFDYLVDEVFDLFPFTIHVDIYGYNE
jgi:hypothetical protein